MAWYNRRALSEIHALQEIIAFQQDKYDQLQADYLALDQGRKEQEESYEAMLLDFRDALKDVATQNFDLQQQIANHTMECIHELTIP